MAIGGGIGSIVIALIVYLLGGDPSIVTDQVPTQSPSSTRSGQSVSQNEDSLKQFVAFVLAETEDTWHEVFRQNGRTYQEPTLVLFTGQVQSACGMAGAAVGPFYCPSDMKAYIDLSFYRDLRDRLGAPGDFAQAYVIAHEIGHHVQNLLGISDRVHRSQQRASRGEANELSVRLELQADYLAGVWAHYAQKKGILDPGDIEEAMNAASAIGDDRLQMQSQGRVVPDAFTHGTSEQRMRWFRRGVEYGNLEGGDTFNADAL
jgi:predicted metalloprotease